MAKLKSFIKNLIFPITFLTVITICSIIVAIQALYIAITNDHTAAIYAAVIVPITLIVIFFYVIERLLIKKISYLKLMIVEFIIVVTVFLIFSYQNRSTSAINNSTTINFYTDQDYILVLFDSNESSLSKFNKDGNLGKMLHVYDTNIIHLDSKLSLEKDFIINYPEHWERFSANRSTLQIEGDLIEYIYSSKDKFNTSYIKNSEAFVDSILKLEKRK